MPKKKIKRNITICCTLERESQEEIKKIVFTREINLHIFSEKIYVVLSWDL